MAEPIIEYHFSFSVQTLKLRQKHVVSGPLDYDTDAELRMLGDHLFPRLDFVEWPKWAWPGGYPIYYVTADCGVLCPRCANDHIDLTVPRDSEKEWRIVAQEINYEDDSLCCAHCGEDIEPAYGAAYDKDIEASHDSGSWMDADALASAGHGTDEDYGGTEP